MRYETYLSQARSHHVMYSTCQLKLQWMIQKGSSMFRTLERFSIPNQPFGVSKVNIRVSDIHRDHGMNQVLKRMNLSQMRSDPCAFTGFDSSGRVNLIVMAYVDDLVASGGSSSVQRFFQETQRTFSLKHIDYLTPDHPVEFLGRVIKKRRSGQITIKYSLLII